MSPEMHLRLLIGLLIVSALIGMVGMEIISVHGPIWEDQPL